MNNDLSIIMYVDLKVNNDKCFVYKLTQIEGFEAKNDENYKNKIEKNSEKNL